MQWCWNELPNGTHHCISRIVQLSSNQIWTVDMWATHFYFFVQHNTQINLKSTLTNKANTFPSYLNLKTINLCHFQTLKTAVRLTNLSHHFTESTHTFSRLFINFKSSLSSHKCFVTDTLLYTECILYINMEKFHQEINNFIKRK